MNLKALLAKITGLESKVEKLDSLEAELKTVRAMMAKAASEDEEEDKDKPEGEGDEDDKEKGKKGKKSAAESEEEEDKDNPEGEGEEDEDDEKPEGESEEEEAEGSISAAFAALLAENSKLKNQLKGQSKKVNIEAARILASAGNRAPVKTKGKVNGTGPKTVTRANFQGMNARQRADFIKGGGKISD